MSKYFLIILLSGLLFGSACSIIEQTPPPIPYQLGEILIVDRFTEGINWDTRSRDGASVGAQNGYYRIESAYSTYVRGFNNQAHENVVIEVDITYDMVATNNAFGVICRGAPNDYNSNGYYFLIGADGSYAIGIGRGGDVDELIGWRRSSVINRGVANNTIRAVCIDDYLALYVNDEFITSVRDDRYQRGFAGLTATTRQGVPIVVDFDNIIIWEAEFPEE